MIYFDKVTKMYGDMAALEEVTLSIAPKEFVSIVGHSGAGKTTLLKLLLAEERPSEGAVFFESIDVNDLPSLLLASVRNTSNCDERIERRGCAIRDKRKRGYIGG